MKTMLQKDLEVLVSALNTAHKDGAAMITVEIDNNRCVSPLVYRMIECFDIQPVFITHRKTNLVHRQIPLEVHELENILCILKDEVQAEIDRQYEQITSERRKNR